MTYAGMLPGSPAGFAEVLALRPALAEAAKAIYDGWCQVDGYDVEFGAGGICHEIADALVDRLSSAGFEHSLTVHTTIGENHVFTLCLIEGDGVYSIDIPPGVYEIGGGFVWKKRDNASFDADVVEIVRIADAMDPGTFAESYGDWS